MSPLKDKRTLVMQGVSDHHARMFASLVKGPGHLAGSSYQTWEPPTDVYETADAMVIRMEIGGVQCEDIEIVVGDNQLLTVRGIRRDPRANERRAYHQMEIHYGVFQRNVYIPKPIDTEGACARYVAGFLEIVLPIARRAQQPVRLVLTVNI